MTTLRRLMVADYPIRLFLLALAAWSVAADVCAQSPIRVGYYDMIVGAGSPGAGRAHRRGWLHACSAAQT